jgi:ABC-type sugar transport system substrate-binding protein
MQKPKIVVSLITEDNDYQREQAQAAQTAAEKLDLRVEIQYAKNDSVNQSLQLLQVIQARPEVRPQGIVVEAAGTSMPQVAQAAAAADIGWALLNRSADYLDALRARASAPIFCLATDNEQVGCLQGKQINHLLPNGGSALFIVGPSMSDVAQQRLNGMLTIKRQDIELKTVRGDWTEASSYKAVKSWLALSSLKDLHIGLVVAQNDAMAMGARKAIEDLPGSKEREATLSAPFLGCDGTENKGKKYVQTRLLRATIITPPLTGTALEMLIEGMRSHSQPPHQTLIQPRPFPPLEEL